MFEQLTDKYAQERDGFVLSPMELAELTLAAKDSRNVHPAVWARFKAILTKNTGWKAPAVASEFRECRITSDLNGAYPYGVEEFVPAFLKSRGYKMNFGGEFGNESDADFILNKMNQWSHEIIGGRPIYAESLIRGAFANWQTTERTRMLKAAYAKVSFDKDATSDELARFADFITIKTGDDEIDRRNARAAEVALANFIYRVKNHLRGVWKHGVHMMPILYGPQGSGKSTAVDKFLSPLTDMSSKVGFDIFEHDGKMYALSTTPVMFFDELAGVTKAEVERIKDIMLADKRELRKLYANPATRTLITTFIGCSNRDVSTMIKDETGNRRFLQIDTPVKLSLTKIRGFDALAMWRSVDEDADAPLYANASDLADVQSLQTEQRHLSSVEVWIAEDVSIPKDPQAASDLFDTSFIPWLSRMYPGQERYENLTKFGKELNRLIRANHPRLTWKNGTSKKLYTIIPTDPEAYVQRREVVRLVTVKGAA
ncbi:MAG: VapE domain-containing protein [Brevundimonas mediterranea]|uniref:VapE domain-containing protein n=1 Tax=Brevundimonas mediterranea TaxID=74329 RepID=UPI00403412AB